MTLDKNKIQELWASWDATRDLRERDELVKAMQELIRAIMKPFCGNGLSADLTQEGNLGLLDALDKYNPNKGFFKTYANIRIKGAILDALRIEGKKGFTFINTRKGEFPQLDYLEGVVDDSEDKPLRFGDSLTPNLISIIRDPFKEVCIKELQSALETKLRCINGPHGEILRLFITRNLSCEGQQSDKDFLGYAEIGKLTGYSEAGVYQICKRYLSRLREDKELKEFFDNL